MSAASESAESSGGENNFMIRGDVPELVSKQTSILRNSAPFVADNVAQNLTQIPLRLPTE
jgi:hypothetical protein